MNGADVAAVVQAFVSAGIEIWIEGGWGVDALVGREGRTHKDVDVIVRISDVDAMDSLLHANGFRFVTGTPPDGFLYRDDAGRAVDVRAVLFDGNGQAVYRQAGCDDFVYPAQSMNARGAIAGLSVRCISPELQMSLHTGYEPSAKDAADVWLLHDTFGIPVPAEYARTSRTALDTESVSPPNWL